MKALLLFGALAMTAAAPARPAPSLAEDVADVATRACLPVIAGHLRWDPSKLEEEKAVLARLGLTPGIPSGVIDSFGPFLASTFNRSILASRSNGEGHVLFALGGQMPGCRVTATGAPATVTEAQMIEALRRPESGWTRAPALDRSSGAIERRSFVRRSGNGGVVLLDLLVATQPSGTFRMMALVLPAPSELKLPDGF